MSRHDIHEHESDKRKCCIQLDGKLGLYSLWNGWFVHQLVYCGSEDCWCYSVFLFVHDVLLLFCSQVSAILDLYCGGCFDTCVDYW